MKMRKILAVLLSVAMLVGVIPAFSLTATAADVGTITNGTFETGDLTGWTYYSWSTSITTDTVQGGSYAVRIGSSDTLTGNVALEQIVPVNMNATYSLSFYLRRYSYSWSGNSSFSVSVELGTTANSFTGTGLSATTPTSAASYTKRSYSFSTGSYKYARIRFNCLGSGKDTALDTIALSTTTEGDTSTHAAPTFVDFGNELNRPNSSANNVIVQPGFESTTSASWNTSDFIHSYLGVATDDDAKEGSKVLHYKNVGTVASWHYFDVTVPASGSYVFSAWVKTPYLSETNQGKASIGIIDPETYESDGSGGQFFVSGLDKYKGHTSTPYQQIRSTATDNQWHLRSVTIYALSGATVRIGVYGVQSEMYIDDISLHLESNGVTYTGDQTGTLSLGDAPELLYCESENNLIEDCNMTGNVGEAFWKKASGWNNGFMNFNIDDQRLEFTGTGASGSKVYHYVKWIPVEKNTEYTMSFDYRVMYTGTGSLRLIDNNIDLPQVIENATLSFTSANSDWATASFTVNSGNYNRIGIVFTDGTATAYFDDFRFFKSSDGISEEPEEEIMVDPSLKPEYVAKSRMEMEDGNLGLAFLFNLKADGVTRVEWSAGGISDDFFKADYTNGKVKAFTPDTTEYTLITAGAVMTNDGTVGQNADLFILENVTDSKTVIDVPAEKLFYTPGEKIHYAVRVTNIPETHVNTLIYARPYYVFDYKGVQITVYGEIQFDSYEPLKDVNDGWLEWG